MSHAEMWCEIVFEFRDIYTIYAAFSNENGDDVFLERRY